MLGGASRAVVPSMDREVQVGEERSGGEVAVVAAEGAGTSGGEVVAEVGGN